MIQDIVKDTIIDTLKLLPFLFATYLVMEYIEHKAGKKTQNIIEKAGKWGPVIGGFLGALPQCGFSAAAASLYAGRMITLGTLYAIFLSTSDEMLPILISEQAGIQVILKLIGIKIFIGIVAGILIDYGIQIFQKKEKEKFCISHMCIQEQCNCKEGSIFRSAWNHTCQITLFILLISFMLNLLIGLMGEEKLALFLTSNPLFGPILAGLIGLIPNCAASIVLTELYLTGILSIGSVIAGLLVGAGIGLLVLFRVNDNIRQNLKITVGLYLIGVFVGMIIETAGLII